MKYFVVYEFWRISRQSVCFIDPKRHVHRSWSSCVSRSLAGDLIRKGEMKSGRPWRTLSPTLLRILRKLTNIAWKNNKNQTKWIRDDDECEKKSDWYDWHTERTFILMLLPRYQNNCVITLEMFIGRSRKDDYRTRVVQTTKNQIREINNRTPLIIPKRWTDIFVFYNFTGATAVTNPAKTSK